MKVILFLAAVYALIINQSQQPKPQVAKPQPVNFTQSLGKDTIRLPRTQPSLNYANYLTHPSVIMHVAAPLGK